MAWTLRTDSAARRNLAEIATAALAVVEGRHCVAHYLRSNPPGLQVHAVALGKAASAMALGAADALGGALVRALVVTKTGHLDTALASIENLVQLEAGHPVPDEHSLQAGAALIDFIATTPPAEPLLVLLSGGTSSLVEVPVPGVDLALLQRVNTWLLGSGLPIGAVNAVRKRLSRIKGGGLCTVLGSRPAQVLLISDVPGDRLSDIGSGMLICSADVALPPVPAWLQSVLDASSQVVAPPRGPCLVSHHIVASLRHARAAAAQRARELGHPVHNFDEFLDGDAAATGLRLGTQLVEGPPGVYVWGGETTVRLPARPGRGGRNQTLALAAAQGLAQHPGTALLALGTDGTDGPTEDAGALIDDTTLARGHRRGLDAERCLAEADAGTFLAASDDLVRTGPTGTNVMDLVIAMKTG